MSLARNLISDDEWAFFEGFIRAVRHPNVRKASNHRLSLDGIFWIARTGAPWRDLPEEIGKWSSVYHQFRRWTLAGLWEDIRDALNHAGLAGIAAGAALVADLCLDPRNLRQSGDPVLTDAFALFNQIIMQLAGSVNLFALGPSLLQRLGLALEVVSETARAHHGLLASKLAKKASTKHGAIQSPLVSCRWNLLLR